LEHNFLRSPNDWEEESVLKLLALLAYTKVGLVDNDKIIWPHDSKGKFKSLVFVERLVKDLVILIFLLMQYGGLRLLPALNFWLRQVPKGRCPRKICLRGEILIWPIDVLCFSKRKNQ